MNREEALRIVTLCESSAQGPSVQRRDVRRPELREQMDALSARPAPAKGTKEQADLYAELYERVYNCLNGETIPESLYIEAQKTLNPRGARKQHDEQELLGALGRVMATIRNPTLDQLDWLADQVINDYLDRMGGRVKNEHSKHRLWIKEFFREYLADE